MCESKDDGNDSALVKKRERLSKLLAHMRSPVVAEMGSGSGLVMEIIRELAPTSLIIGLDHDKHRVRIASGISHTVQCDIAYPCFADECLHTATLISTLHEVFSIRAAPGVKQVLASATRMLKSGGRLIIYDHVGPEPKTVTMRMREPEMAERFVRFARQFVPRKIDYARDGKNIRVNSADAVEFIRFCRPLSEAEWREEIRETTLFWTGSEFIRAVDTAGLVVKQDYIWQEPLELPVSLATDIPLFRTWIGIVAEKR